MPHTMNRDEIFSFLQASPRTGHLATVRKDGRPHVATIWFAIDGDDIVFTTGNTSVKGRNLTRTGRAALSVDDPNPPFAFIALEGTVTMDDDPASSRHWASVIAGRYMGDERAEEFGARNGIPGEFVCRLTPTRMTGMSDVTGS